MAKVKLKAAKVNTRVILTSKRSFVWFWPLLALWNKPDKPVGQDRSCRNPVLRVAFPVEMRRKSGF